MATQHSAVQGRILITSASNKEPAVGTYTLTRRGTLGETTNSLTSGWETHKLIKKGGDFSAKVFYDPTSGYTPEALGIDMGDSFTADMYIGDTGLKYAAVPCVCETIAVKGCDSNGIVEYDITAKTSGAIPDPTSV
jgi:hypothetical protein